MGKWDDVTAATGVDAMVHAIEAYTSNEHGAVLIDNIYVRRNTGNLFLGDPNLGKVGMAISLRSLPHDTPGK